MHTRSATTSAPRTWSRSTGLVVRGQSEPVANFQHELLPVLARRDHKPAASTARASSTPHQPGCAPTRSRHVAELWLGGGRGASTSQRAGLATGRGQGLGVAGDHGGRNGERAPARPRSRSRRNQARPRSTRADVACPDVRSQQAPASTCGRAISAGQTLKGELAIMIAVADSPPPHRIHRPLHVRRLRRTEGANRDVEHGREQPSTVSLSLRSGTGR